MSVFDILYISAALSLGGVFVASVFVLIYLVSIRFQDIKHDLKLIASWLRGM